MAPSFTDSLRSFWHSITTNDRHASHDAPYRTGSHVPLSNNRNSAFGSVTSASESRFDLTDPSGSPTLNKSPPNGVTSPQIPYSPGMRSALRRQSTDRVSLRSQTSDKTAEIQMQSFDDGLPPAPSVRHSWKRIERWMEDNYQELFDNVCEGATTNDVNELEHELDCSLPVDVRESLQVHDGQERGGRPTGVLFGCMLLDCEEIIDEWKNWRKVNDQYLAKEHHREVIVQLPTKAFAGPSSSLEPDLPLSQPKRTNTIWRDELLDKQDSQPPNAVQKAYAHPSWIPLARDWGGNCIGVDLAPAPLGKWGQIIIFGRDYDTKFVIARSWAHFLAQVADDFGTSDKIHVDEESSELKFLQFKGQGVEPPYLEVLRWRCDQRHGRRPPQPRRRSAPSGSMGLRINSSVGGPQFDSLVNVSPYASPVSERGRSPQRFPGKPLPQSVSTTSPRRGPVLKNPLARVAEERGVPPPPPLQRVYTVDNNLSPPSARQARDLRKEQRAADAAGLNINLGHTVSAPATTPLTEITNMSNEESTDALIKTTENTENTSDFDSVSTAVDEVAQTNSGNHKENQGLEGNMKRISLEDEATSKMSVDTEYKKENVGGHSPIINTDGMKTIEI